MLYVMDNDKYNTLDFNGEREREREREKKKEIDRERERDRQTGRK